MKINKSNLLFYLALICAIWFAFMAMAWTYAAALVIAYPVGILSFIIWRSLKRENKKRTKWIPRILAVGVILSLCVLISFLIWD